MSRPSRPPIFARRIQKTSDWIPSKVWWLGAEPTNQSILVFFPSVAEGVIFFVKWWHDMRHVKSARSVWYTANLLPKFLLMEQVREFPLTTIGHLQRKRLLPPSPFGKFEVNLYICPRWMNVNLKRFSREFVVVKMASKKTVYTKIWAKLMVEIQPLKHPRWTRRNLESGGPMLIYGVEAKIGVKPPKSYILTGFSIIFTIHFGVPLFLETPIKTWVPLSPSNGKESWNYTIRSQLNPYQVTCIDSTPGDF